MCAAAVLLLLLLLLVVVLVAAEQIILTAGSVCTNGSRHELLHTCQELQQTFSRHSAFYAAISDARCRGRGAG